MRKAVCNDHVLILAAAVVLLGFGGVGAAEDDTTAATVSGEVAPTATDFTGAQFHFPADPEYLVLELTFYGGYGPPGPPIPRLQLFGDGRAVVRYSPTKVRRGTYERQLPFGEVQNVLEQLGNAGFYEYTQDKADEELTAVRNLSQSTLLVADAGTTLLTLALDGYRLSGDGLSAEDVQIKAAQRALDIYAKAYTEVPQLRAFQTAVEQLRALAKEIAIEENRVVAP